MGGVVLLASGESPADFAGWILKGCLISYLRTGATSIMVFFPYALRSSRSDSRELKAFYLVQSECAFVGNKKEFHLGVKKRGSLT